IGENTNIDFGGAGAGGGLCIRSTPEASQLDHVTFSNNAARGGIGLVRGGYGQGGGLFSDLADINGSFLTFTNNVAIAGMTDGSGILSDGSRPDGIGGGAHFARNGNVFFD